MKKNKRVLVFGLSGYIGKRFEEFNQTNLLIEDGRRFYESGFTSKQLFLNKIDIRDAKSIEERISATSAKVVLHLAAKTHIDPCQSDVKKGIHGETWKINVNATEKIAEACAKYGKHLIFLSTESVFDGIEGWYSSSSVPNPISWYGHTKLEAEKAVINSGASYSIIRSVLAYGHNHSYTSDIARNIYNQIRTRKTIYLVSDQLINFTYINDLVSVLNIFVEKQLNGIFHYGGKIGISPYQFGLIIKDMIISRVKIKPVSLVEFFGNKAKYRLRNATLKSSDKIVRTFMPESDLYQALPKVLQTYKSFPEK